MVGNVFGWVSDTFSSDAKEDDLIKGRSLNSTRIAAVVAPILTGIWAAYAEVKDKEPFNQLGFQKVLIVALVALVGVLLSVDILARAWVSSRPEPVPQLHLLPKALAAKNEEGTDVAGRVLGLRVIGDATDYLFLATAGGVPAWVAEKHIKFS